jgi:glyoxylase-like metal-dependent hydrolase (beta-lactamase superfamily II)
MRQVAEGLWQIPLMPRESVNAYVIGDVLVDAGMKGSGKKLPSLLGGHAISAHTLTHAHPDHVGGSKRVVEALGVPFWAPAGDADAVRAGRSVMPDGGVQGLMQRIGGNKFPSVPIERTLSEGDEVGGFRVIDVPGHSPGHIAFWRESDRVLVVGDVWFNMLLPRLKPGLRDPFDMVTVDVERNHASQRRVAELEPDVVCFGHGPVLRDAAPRLREYVASR